MLAILTAIIAAFTSYNLSTQEQMKMEQARSQEKITLSKIEVDYENKITTVTINNTGTVEVRIRALYEDVDGEITFLDSAAPDPSTHMDTYIAPGKSLSISLVSKPEFIPEAKIIAATERGVKTMDGEGWLLYGSQEPPPGYDPSKLYAGPLMLAFDAFYYQEIKHGNFDPDGTWEYGGVVPKGITCAWKITVTNIGDRDITLNKTSSFTAVSSGSTNVLTWFIDSQNQELPLNTAADIFFVWKDPDQPHQTNNMEKIYQQSKLNCMIFLTFFGYYHDADNTPYAQTIPFEATSTT